MFQSQASTVFPQDSTSTATAATAGPHSLTSPTAGSLAESTIQYIEAAVTRGSATDPRSAIIPSSFTPASHSVAGAATTGSATATTSVAAVSSGRDRSLSQKRSQAQIQTQNKPRPMNGAAASLGQPPGMYVQALYDYEADDQTSLSFHQGDIIQVITQLDTGWWDGVINGVRGWFPSNYCALVTDVAENQNAAAPNGAAEKGEEDLDDDDDEDSEDQYEDDDVDSDGNILDHNSPGLPMEGTDQGGEDQAAFWIPQATPDGRLFYFNTMTGVSTMELPLETPTSATETGPRDRSNVAIPDMNRPPPEVMARGYDRDESETDEDDGTSASEREEEPRSLVMRSQGLRKRGASVSNGLSPATSMDSMSMPSIASKSRTEILDPELSMSAMHSATMMPANSATATSFTNNQLGQPGPSLIPSSFFDDGYAVPLTWNRLVENMRIAVERYREAINNSDRSEFVRKAEDISDHLRLLLAAGSGTTDNHSGQPSIISTNKALYPHFRDMMSKFSKLVLSSHIAAADWPTPDSYAKCLHEADSVLHSVYGYVEVARSQRGEDIPRLVPGFVIGSYSGGNWQNNGLWEREPMWANFMDQDDYDAVVEPTALLDAPLMERLEDLKRIITSSVRRLEEQLVLTEKIMTPQRHESIGDAVCAAANKVIELYRPFLSTVESINLAPLSSANQQQTLTEFASHKQRLFDAVSDLVIACQIVTGPIADEWAEVRGEPLEDRLNGVRTVSRQLEACTSQLYFSLQTLLQAMPKGVYPVPTEQSATADADMPKQFRQRSHSRQPSQLSDFRDFGHLGSFADGNEPVKENYRTGDKSKVNQFFGQNVNPVSVTRPRESEETPEYLRLDLENEIAYDTKEDNPILRGGTLAALVEQLTRHDKLDSPFNNTFLLTYRSFTTASELFEMLVNRFSIQPPYGLTAEEYQTWIDRKQNPIRIRVVNILKSWFDNYWMEGQDAASKDLIRRVYTFAEKSVATTNTPGAQHLMAVLEQRLRGQEVNAKRLVVTMNTATPAPILPKNMKKLKFLDIDVLEFARQLTIIESRLYGKIKPTECLNKTWQKKIGPGEPEPAANVKALILHSNQLTNWVAEMILTQTDLKKRVVVIKHFVSVADKCRSLNNFSALTSIISALATAPIHRLQRTWSQVHAKTNTILEQMRSLMGSTKNFAEYREALHLANPPCIPFFGVYLTDLTFIEDGINGTIKKTSLINFAKRAKTAEVIRDIQQYQNVPYPLQPVAELQDYILTNMQAASDVHEMYDRSLAVEPRENQDEKIARYGSSNQLAFLQRNRPPPPPPPAPDAVKPAQPPSNRAE